MRALFTTIPGSGHLHPLVPLARAMTRRGHEVAFATAPRFREAVGACGLRAFAAGRDWLGSETTPAPNPTASLRRFVEAGAEMALDLPAVIERFRPDVVVREQAELGAWIACVRRGVPCVVHGVNVPWSAEFVRETLADVEREGALPAPPPDPALHGFFGEAFLDIVPPSFRPPGTRPPPGAQPLAPGGFDSSGPEGLPAWVAAREGRPLVFATLGTVFNRRSGVFEAILEAFGDARLDLLLTVGRNVDPARLGAPPAHVRVERCVPQSLALPHCSAVVTHGGFNTTMATLAHGLPLCFLPLGGDQGLNAARGVALGVGLKCKPQDGDRVDPAALRAAVETVLADGAFRARAGALRAEIEAMPGPDEACELVERLAA
jgi:UDP:flavonoid glycosyltransferase YjiC (YdhE family)